MRIAIAAENAPAKTLLPVIKRLKILENQGKLKWNKSEIIALSHGDGVKELLEEYCNEIHDIGRGRKAGKAKRGKFELFYLVLRDTIKALKALKSKKIDLLISCGNAGDVRKSIMAATILNIPILHIEQDIYNPIELISFANIVTVPFNFYENYLLKNYKIKPIAIGGYPMAVYVSDFINTGALKTREEVDDIYLHDFLFNEYLILFLGGDIKVDEIPKLVEAIEKMDKPVVIAPYRFDIEYVKKLSKSPKIKVLSNNIDLLSLMKHSSGILYGAGMGVTIEIAVLKIPALKLLGFHYKHGSVDLAQELNIPIIDLENITELDDQFNYLGKPSGDLVNGGKIAIDNIITIINNNYGNYKKMGKKAGFLSLRRIWKLRKEFS
ncbi:MAG: hypothetical protein LBM96_10985 [Methanobrevibacter sp.]|jgi:UDP-N-acetylglucosamine:LPS N-acetylglucosamine transferase|nr:hypothetical protein [Candidatus Methanoflexus mossambicus]